MSSWSVEGGEGMSEGHLHSLDSVNIHMKYDTVVNWICINTENSKKINNKIIIQNNFEMISSFNREGADMSLDVVLTVMRAPQQSPEPPVQEVQLDGPVEQVFIRVCVKSWEEMREVDKKEKSKRSDRGYI